MMTNKNVCIAGALLFGLLLTIGQTSSAQFLNGDLTVKEPTLHIADSLLSHQQVICSPAVVLTFLNGNRMEGSLKTRQLAQGNTLKSDGTQIYEQSKGAVGWVAMCYRKTVAGVSVNPASAFVITPDGVCLTNYHVLYAFAKDKGIDDTGVFLVRLGNGKTYQLKKVLYASIEDDVAVLQLAIGLGEKLPFVPIERTLPKIGQDLYVLGNPQDMYYVFTKGMVANLYTDALMWPDGKGGSLRNLMAITADFAVGSSGSPILNDRGNVIGMVSSTHVIEQNSTGYPLTQMVIKNAIPNSSLLKALTTAAFRKK